MVQRRNLSEIIKTKIAKNEVLQFLQSPPPILLKAKKTAEDRQWESIRTEVRRNIETATPKEINKMLVVFPKLMTKGYIKTIRSGNNFQAFVWFGGRQKSIGMFGDEGKAHLAYRLARDKLQNTVATVTCASDEENSKYRWKVYERCQLEECRNYPEQKIQKRAGGWCEFGDAYYNTSDDDNDLVF